MTATIGTLIDKRDNSEIIRDQIAQILADESAAQMLLAAAALPTPKDPQLWKLRVFTERANPWEDLLLSPEDGNADRSPIVNVWFDNASVNNRASNTVERQKYEGTFNIDCYGFGLSRDDPDNPDGHIPGDQDAATEAQRAARLVRNTLAAAINTYLQLRPTVWYRMVRSITTFQPQIDSRPVQGVVAVRVALDVHYNEASIQVAGEAAEMVAVDVKRAEDRSILASVAFDYTT